MQMEEHAFSALLRKTMNSGKKFLTELISEKKHGWLSGLCASVHMGLRAGWRWWAVGPANQEIKVRVMKGYTAEDGGLDPRGHDQVRLNWIWKRDKQRETQKTERMLHSASSLTVMH